MLSLFFLRPTKRKIGVNFGVNFGVDFPGKVYSGFQTLPRRTHLRPLQNPPGALGPRLGADLKGCGSSGVMGLADPSELCTSLPSLHPGTRRCYSEIRHGGNIYTMVICKCCKLGPGPPPKASRSTLTSKYPTAWSLAAGGLEGSFLLRVVHGPAALMGIT